MTELTRLEALKLISTGVAALIAIETAAAIPAEAKPNKPVGNQVASAAELIAALKGASGGEVFELKAGSYPAFQLTNLRFEKPVTIRGDGAVIANLIVFGCEGLVFDGLAFRDRIDNSKNGILIRVSKHVYLRGCEFAFQGNGVGHLSCTDLLIEDCRFHDLRSDGVAGGDGCARIAIRRNRFTDFYPEPGDHPDAVQIWTAKAKAPTTDIEVTDNIILRGKGAAVQGIFLGDESAGKFPYERVRITGNLLAGTGTNGIAVGGGSDILIAENVVTGVGTGGDVSRIRVQGVVSAFLRDNQAQEFAFPTGKSGIKETGSKKIAPVKDGGAALLAARR